MNKRLKLKCCNYSLLAFVLPVLATGIILECTGNDAGIFGISFKRIVVIHIVLAAAMMALAAYHLYLHVGSKGWWQKVKKLKSHVTRLLVRIAILTAASGLISLAVWLFNPVHTTVGGIHGKIGYLFIIIAVGHTIKRWKWFSR